MPSQTGQALARLEELKGEIERESKKLSDITSESAGLVSDNAAKRAEGIRLDADNAKKLDEHAEILGRIKASTTEYDGLLEKMRDGESSVTVSQGKKDRIDDEARSLVVEIGTLTADLKKKREELDGVSLLLTDKTEEYRSLVAQVASSETERGKLRDEIAQLQGKKGRIIGSIEDALKQFRIFEGRIGQLSLETGYMIAYDQPEELLDNDDDHGQEQGT